MYPIVTFKTHSGSFYRVEATQVVGLCHFSMWLMTCAGWECVMHSLEAIPRPVVGERCVVYGEQPGTDRPGYRISTSPVVEVHYSVSLV